MCLRRIYHLLTLEKDKYDVMIIFCNYNDCEYNIGFPWIKTSKIFTCPNKHIFCSGCKQKNHKGLCDDRKKDFEDLIKSGLYKSCTREGCDAIIEKNRGCNHMTCKKCKS